MRSGTLRHKLLIEEFVTGSPATNTYGEPQGYWLEFATFYGSLEPLHGRELWAAQAINAETVAVSNMRYLPGLEKNMRIVFENKYYNILEIKDIDMRHIHLELILSEGLHDG